jgi:ribosomal protein S18 acetylase RimI-like enzyme
MTDSQIPLLQQIAAHVRTAAARNRRVVRVGPFVAVLHPADPMPWASCAFPAEPLEGRGDVAEAIAGLRTLFAEARRTLRFEYPEALWPTLAGSLSGAGLVLDARRPLMSCVPGDLRPAAAPGVGVHRLTADSPQADFETQWAIAEAAFGVALGPLPPTRVPEDRAGLAGGTLRTALGLLDGRPVGIASTLHVGDTIELAGVGTVPEARRRGVAATLSSALTADHFASGGTLAWLSAADGLAEAVYRSIGFRTLSSVQLDWIDRPAAPPDAEGDRSDAG